jgi:hypothetical protein
VNAIEWMRKQLEVQQAMLRGERKAELLKSVEDFDKKLQGVEYQLLSRALTTSDDKYFIAAYKVYFNLMWLAGEVGGGAGDVAGGADYGPTDTSVALLDMLEKQLSAAEADYRQVMQNELPAFNRTLAERGLIPLNTVVPTPTAPKKEEGEE